MIRFVRHMTDGGNVTHCIWWSCLDPAEEVFAWFWAQIAIVACLKALWAGESALREVLPFNPPWEYPAWLEKER